MNDLDNIFTLDDLADVDETETNDFEVLPASEYLAEITEVDGEKGSNAKGEYYCVSLTFEVKDEAYASRKVWHRIYTEHSNSDWARKNRGELKRLYLNTGSKNLTDLLNKIVLIKTKVEEYDGKKSAKIVDHYKPKLEGAGTMTTSAKVDELPNFMK